MGYGPCPPARGTDASSFFVWTDIVIKLLLLEHHIQDQDFELIGEDSPWLSQRGSFALKQTRRFSYGFLDDFRVVAVHPVQRDT